MLPSSWDVQVKLIVQFLCNVAFIYGDKDSTIIGVALLRKRANLLAELPQSELAVSCLFN